MKYTVCSKVCGSVVELAWFTNKEEAEKFIQIPCVDEFDPEYTYFPNEMWVEEHV